MRLVEIPFTLTVAFLSFAFGLIVALSAVIFLPRFERFRRWVVSLRGGQMYVCYCCRKTVTQPHLVGAAWHVFPKWFSNPKTNATVCSSRCARILGDQVVDERAQKVSEVVDVVLWATGSPPAPEREWITGKVDA